MWTCQREFVVGGAEKVTARIGVAEQVGESEWKCCVEVGPQVDWAFGIDGMQAAMMAYQLCREMLEKHYPDAVWAATGERATGIPRHIVNTLGPAFEGFFERAHEHEHERIAAILGFLALKKGLLSPSDIPALFPSVPPKP